MASQLFENLFTKGLDKDTELSKVSRDALIDAKNCVITGDKDFYALKQLKSTKELQQIQSNLGGGEYEILGAFPAVIKYTYTEGVESNNSIVIFSLKGGDANLINFYDIVRDKLHIYSTSSDLNLTAGTTIDAFVTSEQGVEELYFVDGVNPLRRIILDFDATVTPTPEPDVRTLTVQRYAPYKSIDYHTAKEGRGSLISGTYQFAYRWVNEDTGIASTYSLLTNPIPVYPNEDNEALTGDLDPLYGGLPNEATTYALFLTIEESNLDSLYTSLQLAVIKNIDGSKGVQTVAYQSEPRRDWVAGKLNALDTHEGIQIPYNGYPINYTGLEIESEISVSEIVVDDAPIKTFKTIDLKDNRIIGGNVSYFDRVVKPSDISIGDAYTIKREIGGQGGYDYNGAILSSGTVTASTYFAADRVMQIVTSFASGTISDYCNVGDYVFIELVLNLDFQGYYKVIEVSTDTIKIVIEDKLNGIVAVGSGDFVGEKIYIPYIEKKDNHISYNRGGYKNIYNNVNSKGYFRDEVYRFGLTYMDEFGNWSNPVPIDFSQFKADGVIRTGEKYNQTTTGVDWKFPRRDTNEFSLFAQELPSNSDNANVSALGLKLENITNHPSWAKAVAVVRTRRIKDIVGQSPHIPVIGVQPTQNITLGGAPLVCEVDVNANTIGTMSPKRLHQGAAKNILTNLNDPTTGGVSTGYRYYYNNNNDSEYSVSSLEFILNGGHFFFPEYLYQFSGTSFDFRSYLETKIDIVDACNFFMTPPFAWDPAKRPPNGRFEQDQSSLAFRADSAFNYYYNYNTAPQALSASLDTSQTPNIGYSDFVEDSNAKVTSNLFTTNGGVALPLEVSFKGSDVANNILTYWDTDNVAKSNFAAFGVTPTKGTLIQLDGFLGDATNLSWNGSGSASYGGFNNTTAQPYRADAIDWKVDASVDYRIDGDNITTDAEADFGASPDPIYAKPNINIIPNGYKSPIFASWIVNFKKGLLDDRYGDTNQSQEYIFTGAYATINDPATDSITLEVFGGDCFITKPTFKLNDSVAAAFFTDTTTFPASAPINPCFASQNVNRLCTYRDFQEVISCYVESEVNCDLQANKFRYPVIDDEKQLAFSGDYTYDYHFGYSAQNEQKVFTSIDLTNPTSSNEFKSRVINSDVRILQSTQVGDNGFDRFRNTSFYDMPEDYGGITKFEKLSNDNVYVFQERGVSILPINAKVIQTATGDQLSINTTDLYDTPRYLMTENGCQHMRSIAKSDTEIIFFDAESREVLKVGGSTGNKISDVGMYSYFKDNFDTNLVIPQNKISAVYDYNRSEYILMLQDIVDTDYVNNVGSTNNISKQVAVFSDKTQTWHSEYRFTNNLYRMVFAGKELYAFADDATANLKLYEMYGGDGYLNIFGTDEEAEFSMVVNPESTIAKTYDNIRISSSNRLKELAIQAYEENGVTQDTVMSLDVVPRDNGYEVPALRNQSGGRMRGRYFVLTGTIDDTTNEVSISSVTSKYRLSNRIFR